MVSFHQTGGITSDKIQKNSKDGTRFWDIMIMHDISTYVDNSYVLFVCNVSDFDLSK